MLRQQLVAPNASVLRALCVGVGVGPGQQLSPRLCRGTFNHISKVFFTNTRKKHIPQHVFPYTRLAASLPAASACRQPIPLTSDITRIRAYTSRRRAPPSPSIQQRDEIYSPNPSEPEEPRPDVEDFAPKRQIKYIERGFLAVFIALFVIHQTASTTMAEIHQKEMKEASSEIAGNAQTKVTLRVEGQLEPVATFQVTPKSDHNKYNMEVSVSEQIPEPDTAVQELEINLSEPGKLLRFVRDNFVVSPAKIFPVDGSNQDFRPWTAVTSSLLHGAIFHLIACYLSLKVFTTPLILLYGPQKFFGLFFAGAGLATTLYSGAERMINPAVSMTQEQRQQAVLKGDPKERNAVMRYFTGSVGSSGALVALGTVCMFVAPWLRASILISPPLSIRTLMLTLFVFDVGGQFFFDYGLHINHGIHLAGYASGLILHQTLVRKWPFSRNFQEYLRAQFRAQMRNGKH